MSTTTTRAPSAANLRVIAVEVLVSVKGRRRYGKGKGEREEGREETKRREGREKGQEGADRPGQGHSAPVTIAILSFRRFVEGAETGVVSLVVGGLVRSARGFGLMPSCSGSCRDRWMYIVRDLQERDGGYSVKGCRYM